MTITFASIIGIPFLYVSDVIVRKIGSVNVIVLAFLAYCVRFFGYSFIWLVPKFEISMYNNERFI